MSANKENERTAMQPKSPLLYQASEAVTVAVAAGNRGNRKGLMVAFKNYIDERESQSVNQGDRKGLAHGRWAQNLNGSEKQVFDNP